LDELNLSKFGKIKIEQSNFYIIIKRKFKQIFNRPIMNFYFLLFVCLVTSSVVPFAELKTPIILAHRGSRFLNPENSRVSFYSALEMGTDVLETDVRLTKDKKLVIFHDKSVERVSNGFGNVKDKTLKEMKSLDIGYHFTHDNGTTFPYRGRNVQVMELSEFYKEFFPLNIYVNIEIKDDSMEAAEVMFKVLSEFEINFIEKHVNIVCSYFPVLERLRNLSNRRVPTSACEYEGTLFAISSKFSLNLFYDPLDYMDVNLFQMPCVAAGGSINLKTSKIIQDLHSKGKSIHYWVINDKETMREVVKLGADGIITDRIDLAIEVWEELGIRKAKKIFTKEFYLPTENFIEIYTCTTYLCQIIENFEIILVGFVLFCIILFFARKFSNQIKNRGMMRKKNE
jgi:glycerophosphoryl diester phosphodiesterase